jgi:hypothetical protein
MHLFLVGLVRLQLETITYFGRLTNIISKACLQITILSLKLIDTNILYRLKI